MTCKGDDDGSLGRFRPLPVSRSMLREVEPITSSDGRVLKQYELMFGGRGTGLFYVEDPMDLCPQYEIVKVKPMPMPSAALLDLTFRYGKTDEPDKSFVRALDTEYSGLTDEELARLGITRKAPK